MTEEFKSELRLYCHQILSCRCNSKTQRQTRGILELLKEHTELQRNVHLWTDQYDKSVALVAELSEQNQRLTAMLEKLEYCCFSACPECNLPESTMEHEADCELGKLLAEIKEKQND